MYDEADYRSYNEFNSMMRTARNPEKGKPLRQRWARMYKDNDDIVVHITGYGSQPLFRVTPDNILEFVLPKNDYLRQSNTLTQALYRLVPIHTERLRTGVYRIAHTKQLEMARTKAMENGASRYDGWRIMNDTFRQVAFEYEQGIKFDLTTGECLNGTWTGNPAEIPEKRREWRAMLRKFKRGMRVRAKVHALDGVIDQVWAERQSKTSEWSKPDWHHDNWVNLLQTSIENDEYPQELLKGFVQSCPYSWYQPKKPTAQEVLVSVDKVCNDLSTTLRRRLGVFETDEQATVA